MTGLKTDEAAVNAQVNEKREKEEDLLHLRDVVSMKDMPHSGSGIEKIKLKFPTCTPWHTTSAHYSPLL